MGCYLQKYPDLSHSLDTWKTKLFNAQKPRGATLINGRIHYLEVIGGGTRLAMPKTILRAGLIVIEAWFRGY